MNIDAYAALQVQSMVLGHAREYLAQARAQPVPASAPREAHAGAILQLSAAAQNLLAK